MKQLIVRKIVSMFGAHFVKGPSENFIPTCKKMTSKIMYLAMKRSDLFRQKKAPVKKKNW